MGLVDGHVRRAHLSIGEADSVGGLGAREHDLGDAEPRRGVVARHPRARLEFLVACIRRQCVEDLAGVGEIDGGIGNIWDSGGDEVRVRDLMSALDEMLDGMAGRLATPSGEENAHGGDGNDPAGGPGQVPSCSAAMSGYTA